MIKTRNGQTIVTNEGQNKLLKKLYGSTGGRILLKGLTAPALSRTVGKFMDSRYSKPLIKPFIKKSGIDTSEYVMDCIYSYNSFFTRKVKPSRRPIDYTPDHLISPCDSKLTAYKIGRNSIFRIKGSLPKENGKWLKVNATKEKTELAEVENGQPVLIAIGDDMCREKIDEYLKEFNTDIEYVSI